MSFKLWKQAVGNLRHIGEEILIQSKNYFRLYLHSFRNMQNVTNYNCQSQSRPSLQQYSKGFKMNRAGTLVTLLLPRDSNNAESKLGLFSIQHHVSETI